MRFREFVFLMATLMSLVALSIDAMLPALAMIGEGLGVARGNDTQFVISSLFAGMSVGILVFGPLSDSWGRKPAIALGIGVYIVGCVIALVSWSFPMLLAGRVLQGFGTASTRIVTLAIIRDRYQGDAMGRVMSLIMIVFIGVPVVAPSIGQLILLVAPWRTIFGFLLVMSVSALVWFLVRQPETLAPEMRLSFSVRTILAGARETFRNRAARGYMFAAGMIFGALVAYVSTARQVFQDQYGAGKLFPLYFGATAIGVGLSSFLNSRLVMKHGMRVICRRALMTLTAWSSAWLLAVAALVGQPPLVALMCFYIGAFLCFGMLFGNFSSLALESLGHVAGVASSAIGAAQTLVSVALGVAIGRAYDGTVTPLVGGFAALSLCSLAVVHWTEREAGGQGSVRSRT
jgi:DHA1 family bicyclomycin/chloramphenicol resistance-like MFS transporter